MSYTPLVHARWCAFSLITAIAVVGCSSNVRTDDGNVVQATQAVVMTTPINVNVALPADVTASSVLLCASNKLTINGAGIVGDARRLTTIAGLGSGNQLLIQAGSKVFGSIYSNSTVTVSPNTTVFGSVRSGGSVDVQAPSQVLGGVTENSAPAQAALGWVVNWPNDAGIVINREAKNTAPAAGTPGEAIAPGHYSDFNIKSRNRMTFTTGTYYIESFNLEPEAEIMLDSASGPIILYIKSSFRYSGKFLPVRDASGVPTVREGGIRAVYLGTNAAEISGPYVGVLIAPNADLNLNSPNSGQHKGGFFAKNIMVAANSSGTLWPLDFDLNDFTRGETKYGDADNDGTTDDRDLCPKDPKKIVPGVCGCQVPDTDSNGDGIPNCIGTGGEFCTGKPAGTQCYSTICPNNKAQETCNANGVCGDPVTECAPGGGGATSGCTYKLFQTSIYWICNKDVTWQAAAAACREVPGRSLVQVDGVTENAWLDFVTSSNMWIGASSATSGTFAWAQGTDNSAFPFWAAGASVDGRFTNWQAGQPSGETCGAIQSDGTWAAKACATTQGFICEQPLIVSSTTGDGNICNFYPGAVCPGKQPPTTCVPATDIMAGTPKDFADATNDCYNNCNVESLVGTPACDDHCKGVLPIPTGFDRCSTPIGVVRPVCNIAQTGYGDVCQPGVTTCADGKACGRIYECAQLNAGGDPIQCTQNSDCSTNICHGTHRVCIDPAKKLSDDPDNPVWSNDTSKCFASYHCGTPTEDSCDTEYFTQGMDPCNEVEICSELTEHGESIDPLAPENQSNLSPTVFNPDSAFKKPDPAVTTPFASAKPKDCGDAGEPQCNFGIDHPWCKPQVAAEDNKIKSQTVTDKDSPDDKKGKSGGTGPLSFDFDPNLAIEYNIKPTLFGDSSEFYVDAKASVGAAVHLTQFLGFSTDINVLDALGEVRADRCGLKVDAHTKLLGVDFLPSLMDTSELHKFDTDATTRKKCEDGIVQFQTEVARVAKALRDAQELIHQYKTTPPGTTLNQSFCTEVISGFIPWDFPEINCAKATPDQVVNAFIDYYQQQAVALASKGIDNLSVPSFGGLSSTEIELANTESRENQNLLNLPFAIGPIPMNLTVDAYLTYGVSGGLQFGLTPSAFLNTLKNRNPADLAYARVNAVPHGGAGIEMFVGAGFDCGFASAKVGVSGDVNVADITVPLSAGANLTVRSEPDNSRPLPDDLKEANGSANYEVYFPPVGPSRFVFGAGYEYNAAVHITDILHGTINAQLKLKFLFFSKTWRVKIAEFSGLQGLDFPLFSGKGGMPGALDHLGVSLGSVSMPLPFLKLPHVAPVPAGAVANVPFNRNRVEHVFYDNQCAVHAAQACPTIFAAVPQTEYWLDAESSNYLVAYGSNGVTLGSNVNLASRHLSGTNYNGSIAMSKADGTFTLGSYDHLGDINGGKTLTYSPNSNGTKYANWYHAPPSSGIGDFTHQVPEIILQRPFPTIPATRLDGIATQTNPLHYLPGDLVNSVTVQNGGTLSLDGSGVYYFKSLRVLAGGSVVINHAPGAVEVVVKEVFEWRGQLVNGNGTENAHVIGYYNTTPITLYSGFNGTFVAPNAPVTVAPATYRGAVYAKQLTVQTNTQMEFLPCHPWAPDPPPIVIF